MADHGLTVALRELRRGKLLPALAGLEGARGHLSQQDHDLKTTAIAEVLQLAGNSSGARQHAQGVIRDGAAAAVLRSRCLTVLGNLAGESGDFHEAAACHGQAIELARASGDAAQLAKSQLRLLSTIADRHNAEFVAPSAADVHKNIMRSGDAQLLAYYHMVVGRIDAKRGLLDRARKHLQRAEALLRDDPNLVLEAISRLDASTISALMGQYEDAVACSKSALEASVAAGAARTHTAAVANLGQLLLYIGRLGEARPLLEQALRLSRDNPELRAACLDSLAQLSLGEGDVERAHALVEQALAAIPSETDLIPSWYHLSVLSTEISVLKRRRNWPNVILLSAQAIKMSDARADRTSSVVFRAWAAEAHAILGEQEKAERLLVEALRLSEDSSFASQLHLGRAQSVVLGRSGKPDAAECYRQRTRRLADALGDARAKAEIDDTATLDFERIGGPSWNDQPWPARTEWHRADVQSGSTSSPESQGLDWLSIEGMSHLLSLSSRPLALGRETVCALTSLGCVSGYWLGVREPNGLEQVSIAQRDSPRGGRDETVVIGLGVEHDGTYEVRAVPRDTFHARTTLLAIKRLVENAVALEILRRQQKERTSLWPVEIDVDGQAGLFASPAMREVVALAHRIAQSGAPVLITGETGVGKEVIAREIHARSPQASGRFVPYNCTAVPRDMMDSQLFGHRRGAFTGAMEHAPGLIRSAQGGTVFLDEIGELSLESQPKLLRFLESSEIQPIGEPQPVRVSVRVIAATNADLGQLVREGRFREDLFYRLDILRLPIPPLRERREEVPAFCSYFLDRYCRESRKPHMDVSDEALEYLVLYDWPGNVRQLAAEMRRIVALAAPGAPVTAADLSATIRASRRTVDASQPVVGADDVVVSLEQPLPLAVEALERAAIERAMRQSRGRVERAAETLGISRKGLFLKRKRLGLPVGDR